MIISDLDGTLLRSDQVISRESIDFINGLNVPFVVATGRIVGDVKKLLNGIKFKYAITANGAIIYDMEEDKVIYEKHISKEAIKKCYDIIKNTCDETYVSMIDDWTKIENEETLDKLGNTYTMSAFFNKEEDYRELEDDILGLGLKTLFMKDTYSDRYYMEILSTGLNKRVAIEYMLSEFGLEIEDILAFGDSENDLEMLGAVGHGVAMKNAVEELKEIADDIAPKTNDEDGVMHYIKEKLGVKAYV
jgi:HAD superfamily hydrolase (TIGR01484 family)